MIVIGIAGGTGSGKTTILSLICRNYDIQKGQILIDGIDIKKIKISSLRRHFGQMLQDVFLFSGDIRSNILLREEGISDEEVMEACRYVNADSFINKLEAGLDEVANLITTGSDSVGVVESMISDEFKEILLDSPFVISKGMGNFEGLTEMTLEGQDIFVLLCTKCSSISKELGLEVGSHILTTL